MKTSIFGVLCLLLMVFHSYSFPQLSEECSYCTANDEACWENCSPCGLINVCLKPRYAKKTICKNSPKEMPARCLPAESNSDPCVLIRACQKPWNMQNPKCKDVPTTLPSQCSPPPRPPPPTITNMPTHVDLNVNVYLSFSLRREDPDALNKAKEVLLGATEIFNHETLDTKINLRPHYIDLDQNHTKSHSGLNSFMNALPRQYLKHGTLHMLLTVTNDDSTNSTTNGIAYQNSICGSNYRLTTGIVGMDSNLNKTSQDFAHTAAHSLGIDHDFENAGRRDFTCGPPKLEGGFGNQIMNEGEPRSSTWSSCSNHDFKRYYERVKANSDGEFCLTEYF